MRQVVLETRTIGSTLRALSLAASLAGGLIAGALPALGQDVADKDPNKIIKSYGYSTYGDLKYPADFAHFDYVNPDAPKGGEMSLWTQGTFDNFNPYTRKGRAGGMSSSTYESMLVGAADEISGLYCLLCESLEYNETEDWVIFHMRKDIKFSDGTPMTAADVVFSHEKLVTEGLPSYAEYVRPRLPKVEALDDYTVKFTFGEGFPRKDLISQAGGVPVFEKAWFDKTGARLDEPQMEMPPGSGPYMLDSFEINQRVIYKRNPEYWGKDLPVNVGRNNFDKIRIEYFTDATAAFEGFKAGVYTFRTENTSLIWATQYDFPALQKGWVVKETPRDGSVPYSAGYVFNLRKPLFQDRSVRLAIGLMMNRDWTNKSLQYNLYEQRVSYWQGSELMAVGKAEGKELEFLKAVEDKIDPDIRDLVMTGDAFLPHASDADRQLDRKNLRAASKLLEEDGWVVGDDGMRRKDGKTLDLEILGANPGFDRIIEPYVQNLRQLGVNATYNRVDPAQYSQRVNTGTFDYDMIYDGYSNGLEEGTGLSQRFGTSGKDDLFNPAGYASPAVDELIEMVIRAKSYDEMAAGVRAVDRILRATYFEVPTWYRPEVWLAYFDMYGHPDPLPPYSIGVLDFWWYDQDKAAALVAAGALRQ